MDPNANLKEQLQLADAIVNTNAEWGLDDPDFADNAVRLAELVISMNDWLTNGGFLPDQWRDQSVMYLSEKDTDNIMANKSDNPNAASFLEECRKLAFDRKKLVKLSETSLNKLRADIAKMKPVPR